MGMKHSASALPVLKFIYAYDRPGSILDGETIEVESTNEADAYAKARAKLDRAGFDKMQIRLLGTEPTGRVRGAA